MLVDDIATRLASAGAGVVGTSIFKGRLPDEPTPCLAVIDYPGAPGDFIMEQAFQSYSKPHIQVIVRGADYPTGMALINTAFRSVDSIKNATLSGTRYLGGFPLQPPYLLQIDANNLPIFIFNAELWKVES